MKKLLTIIFMSLAVVIAQATEKTVWEGNEAISWNTEVAPGTQYESPEGTFNGLKIGDIIRVYTTTTYDEPQYVLTYKKGDSWEWTNIETTVSEGILSFTVSDETMATEIAGRGLIIRGQAYTITKITIDDGVEESNTKSNVLWTGDVAISWDSSAYEGVQFDTNDNNHKVDFSCLAKGDIIKITTSNVEDGAQYAVDYKAGTDWSWTALSINTDTKNLITYTVESDDIASLIAERGIVIKGIKYHIIEIEVEKASSSSTTQYTLTVTAENGSVIVKQGETDVTGTTTFAGGTELTLTANPAEGYIFEKWTIGETESTGNPLSVTMSEDKTVTASFKDAKILDWNHEYSTGNTGLNDIRVNDRIQIVFTDESTLSSTDDIQIWQKDANWSGTQISSGTLTDKVYEFAVADEAVCTNIKERGLYIKGQNATFKELQVVKYYAVTITAPTNGTITVKNGDNVVSSGDYVPVNTSLTLTATPDEGYSFSKWAIGAVESTENPHTITVTEATSIAATFTANAVPAFSLDGFSADNGNSYDATHKLTTVSEWSGMQLWIGDNSTYNGNKLVVKTAEDCKLKITVGYVGEGQAELSDETANKNHAVTLESNKKIQKVIIQNQEAGTVTFTEFALDPSYTLTVTSPENGSFTVKNGDTELSSGESVAYGTTLTLTATASSGYSFTKWTIGETEATENPHTLTVTEATSIAATFTANAVPAFSLDGFSADNGNSYDATHKLTTVSEWSGMQLWIGDNSTYNGSKLVVKTAEDCKLKITVGYVGEGQAELSDETANKNHAVTLESNKKIQKVIIQNQEAGTVTFTEFALDPSYTLTVTSPENGSFTVKNGDTELSSGESVAYGTTLTLTATASSGYSFTKWTIGETEATENPHTLTVTEATSIAATFTANAIPAFSLDGFSADNGNSYDATHKLTTVSEWSGMQLWIGDNSTYNGNKLVVKTAEDCKLKITVGYVGEGQAELSDETANKNHAVTLESSKKIQKVIIQNQEAGTVTFTEFALDPSYTLTVTSPENGSFTVKNGDTELSSGESVAYGTTLTLTATASSGYSFTKWTIGETEATENPHTLTVTEATSIAATFTANAIPAFSLDGFSADNGNSYDATHKLTTVSEWSGMQLWIGDNSTYNGSKLVVKTAEDCKLKITVGYVGEGQAELSDEAAGKSHAVTLDNTKKIQKVIIQNQEAGTVTFSSMELDPSYTLTILSAENGSFTVSDGTNDIANDASVAYGTSLTLSATPSEGYSFTKWTIGEAESTENPHILTVTGDTSIAATFTTNPTVEPVFTDGKADLSKLESQNAEKVTVNVADGKATITATEGWTGVQLTTTTADNVSGKELRITFAEAAKVKAYVKYSDETDKDSIMSEASTVLYLPIDDTKTVYQVQIQPTEATTLVISEIAVNAESTKPAEPAPAEETGVNISLDVLNEGWSSSYNPTTKTITTTGEWAACGWKIGDDRYNDKGSITVKFNAVEFGVTLKMEYTNTANESKAIEAGAAAGETEVELDIPTDVKTIDKVYITYQSMGTLTLTEATVNDKVVDNRTEKTLVERSQAIADGDITINRGLFSNAVKGDKLMIYGTPAEGAKIALEPADYSGAIDGANWTAFEESPFVLKLTENLLTTLKAKNLLVRGEKYTFTKAVLYTESDLGSEVSDDTGGGSEPEPTPTPTPTPEPEPEPKPDIIDTTTGEVSTSKLSPMGDNATYDATTGVMTTTEPWAGVQIWFNEPEKTQTKNILVIDIEEPNARVQVTVAYTDGTETSGITSGNAGARSTTRAAARTAATPGTRVIVPVDPEKEIQKIMFQAIEPGTITILSITAAVQPLFADGKANLSMLKPQGGKVTYDTSSFTLATTSGWTGVTATITDGEEVSGELLVAKFGAKTQVKFAVEYTDGTQQDTIMSEPSAILRMLIDGTKNIKTFYIQPTQATVIQLLSVEVMASAAPDHVYFSADGVADLSRFEPMGSNATYNTTTHTMQTTEDWAGIQMWLNETEQVAGPYIGVETEDDEADIQVTIGYEDGTETVANSDNAILLEKGLLILVPHDGKKRIQKVIIQGRTTGTVTLRSIRSRGGYEVSRLTTGEARVLWRKSQGSHLAWNEVCKKDATYGAILEEGMLFCINVTSRDASNDWPKVFVRDAQSNQVGQEVLLHEQGFFPYEVRIPLTSDMISQLANGFCVSGDGVTIDRIRLYKPLPPQPGDINLLELNGGYSSTYNAATQTIVTTSRWGARGWDIGDDRYNAKQAVRVGFEPVAFPVTLKMVYVDADGVEKTTSTGVAAGAGIVEMPIPEGIRQINSVYLQYQEAGELRLTSATVIGEGQDELPTAISTVEGSAKTIDSEAWYTLQGQRIAKPARGVYIHQGRKVIVK